MLNSDTSDFCALYNLKNLIKELTCYISAGKPIPIDYILTNQQTAFLNSSN